jgi:hypothetical protein
MVGDSECWTLADGALEAAGLVAVQEGHEPPMRSVGRVHGQCVLEWSPGSGLPISGLLGMAGVRGGDIVEMTDGHFRTSRTILGGGVGMRREEKNVRLMEHTAVMVSVVGDRIEVVEQNAGVEKMVTEGAYDLGDMMEGTVRVFRPVGRSYRPQLKGICLSW